MKDVQRLKQYRFDFSLEVQIEMEAGIFDGSVG